MAVIKTRFTCRIRDGEGGVANATAYVSVTDTQTIAQLVTAMETFATSVDALTAGTLDLVSCDVVSPFAGADKTSVLPDSKVAETLVIDFAVPSNGRSWGFAVPALNDIFRSGGKVVDTSGDVSSTSGLMGGSSAPYLYGASDWLALGAAKATFLTNRKRGHLRGRSRTII